MLRTFRKYRKSILGLVAIGMVALAMSGFGVNFMQPSAEVYAIKIDDQIIPFSEFEAQRRAIEANYQSHLAGLPKEYLEILRSKSKQQAIDALIARSVLRKKAQDFGFYATQNAVREKLISDRDLFPNGFDMQSYKAFLNASGLESSTFEKQLQDQALIEQLLELVKDSIYVSEREAKLALQLEEYAYDVSYIEITPESVMKETAAPSEEQISSYYDEHAGDFEIPSRVAYEYALLDPKQYESLVEVTADDLELYYSDYQSRFKLPEEVKARHILIQIAPDATPEQREAAKAKAEEILRKISASNLQSGASEADTFSQFAKVHSQDLGSALSGGDLGWLKRGKMSKAFDQAAFKLKVGEVSSVIETPAGFEIIRIDERREERVKELEEVKAEIEKEIRAREAPAYTASSAHDLFEEWKKFTGSFADFAASKSLVLNYSGGLLASDTDPQGLTKLSAQALELADAKRGVVELAGKSALVLVNEYKEAEIAPLSQVREKVMLELKKQAAIKLAREKAQSLVEELQKSASNSLADLSKAHALNIKEEKSLKAARAAGIFSNPELHSNLFTTFQAMQKPTRAFEIEGKFYILQVTRVEAPKEEDLASKLEQAKQREEQALRSLFINSFISQLKQAAKIDINPSLFADG